MYNIDLIIEKSSQQALLSAQTAVKEYKLLAPETNSEKQSDIKLWQILRMTRGQKNDPLIQLIKGTKLIKTHQKEVKKIKRFLDRQNLPYLAIIPNDLLEWLIKEFNFFHFRHNDFDLDRQLFVPFNKTAKMGEDLITARRFEDLYLGVNLYEGIATRKNINEAYQGKVSYCLFKNCSGKKCKFRLCQPDDYPYNIHKSENSWCSLTVKNKHGEELIDEAVKFQVEIPAAPDTTIEKIAQWNKSSLSKHLWKAAEEKVVKATPPALDSGCPIIGCFIPQRKRKPKYSAIIDQYGPFVTEKQFTQAIIGYYQEILGRGINLAERIN